MNVKLLLAAAAAASALTAMPASAQFFDYRPQTITIREHSREFTVDRGDRLYWELRTESRPVPLQGRRHLHLHEQVLEQRR
jgi:hypothetical protein